MSTQQDKIVLFGYLDKIEKGYHKTIKIVSRTLLFGIDLELPEKQNMFSQLKTAINDSTFRVPLDLLEKAKKIADQINLKAKYPGNYINELIITLSDLFLVIIYGYYSTNPTSYSQKLIQFFDLIFTLNEAFTPYIKNNIHDHRHSYLIENKTQWFSVSRDMFRNLFKLESYDNYEAFESDEYYRDLRFTIKIVKNKLQIVYKKKFKPSSEFEDYYKSYKIMDEFNRKNYEFILNFEKIFKEDMEKKEWYKHFISNFYFTSERVTLPDPIQ